MRGHPTDVLPGIRDLYHELHQIDEDMKPLSSAGRADNRPWQTPGDLDRYYSLRRRREEIIIELAELIGEMR